MSEITILGGFLGSGKTTLLKRFLEREFSAGARPVVIMSEFGDEDVDGALIADERIELKTIFGGCICCSNRNELEETMQRMLRQTPKSHVYIETSGLADPAGVLSTIMPVARRESASIKKIIVVYDASRQYQNQQDLRLIEKQLMTADIIVLNKIDLAPDRIDGITEFLYGVNPPAKIIKTVTCNFDLPIALEGVTSCFVSGEVAEVDESQYQSFTIKFDSRLSQHELQAWLDNLPPEVLRVKGFVRFKDQNGVFEIQAAGKNNRITPFETFGWLDSYIVVITHPISARAFLKGLRNGVLVDDAGVVRRPD